MPSFRLKTNLPLTEVIHKLKESVGPEVIDWARNLRTLNHKTFFGRVSTKGFQIWLPGAFTLFNTNFYGTITPAQDEKTVIVNVRYPVIPLTVWFLPLVYCFCIALLLLQETELTYFPAVALFFLAAILIVILFSFMNTRSEMRLVKNELILLLSAEEIPNEEKP